MTEDITAQEMAAVDENSRFWGLSPLQLMENAGAAVAGEIKNRFEGSGKGEEKRKQKKVTIIAGKGNNGGDAFVAARHLDGFEVKILLIGRSKDLRTEEARSNWRILKESGYGSDMEEIADSSALKAKETLINHSDVIVDAIFGTGIKGKIREPEATAIDMINGAKTKSSSNVFVVAVDVPSGLDPDTGKAEGEKAVKADLTVTFHKSKKGLRTVNVGSEDYVGELIVVGIGIPQRIEKLAGPGDVRMVMKQRRANSHKGDNGRVLIVGGGAFFGAPTLAALAALHAGADWVTIATPKSVSSIISSFSPNLIVQSLSADILVEEDVPTVCNLAEKHDVMVIGMGLGADEGTKEAVRLIIEDTATRCKKVIIDADGFYGLRLPIQTLGKLEDKDKRVIVTPHAGEFTKMRGVEEVKVPAEDRMEERIKFVADFSRQNKVVTLMKGPSDIISDGIRVKINTKGNAGMTVGGTGDVLAGITGALFAIFDDSFKVATAAAFINGTAGDLAFENTGYGLLATDVVEKITRVIKQLR